MPIANDPENFSEEIDDTLIAVNECLSPRKISFNSSLSKKAAEILCPKQPIKQVNNDGTTIIEKKTSKTCFSMFPKNIYWMLYFKQYNHYHLSLWYMGISTPKIFYRSSNFPSGPKYEQLLSEVIKQLELLTICYWWTMFLVNKTREKLTQEHYWQISRRCKRFNPWWFREPSPKANRYKYNCSEPPVYLKVNDPM